MFEHLTYKKIIVTGPQRGGTRIATTMIAQDTGLRFVDESEVGYYDIEKMRDFIKYEDNFVIQAPNFSNVIDTFPEDILIVFMKRDINDVKYSKERVKRIGKFCNRERRLNDADKKAGRKEAPFKYEDWEKQKKNIINWIEVEYESLCGHPLWVPKEERGMFQWNQTKVNQFSEDVREILCNI